MKIGQIISVFVLGMLLLALLVACSDNGSGSTITQSTPTSVTSPSAQIVKTSTTQSTPPSVAPQNTPTADVTKSTPTSIAGGCTTIACSQQAIIAATPQQVKPGGQVTITGTGWFANTKTEVSIGTQAVESNTLGTMSDANGKFSITLTIVPHTPDFGPTDIHVYRVEDTGNALTVHNQLTIVK